MPTSTEIPYGSAAVKRIQQLYVVAILFWTVLIVLLRIPQQADPVTIILLGIPFGVFFLNFQNADDLTPSIEKQADQGVATFLSFGFMVVIILINWNEASKSKTDKAPYFRLIAAALVLMVLSLIDVRPNRKNLPLTMQARSAFRTMSLTLFVLAFYKYYSQSWKKNPERKNL